MKRLNFLFLFLALAGLTFAQKAQTTEQAEANLRKHVEYLASDKLEGRRTGEPGATLAAKYVEDQFRQFRLRPGYKAARKPASYRQTFPFVTGVEAGAGNSFKLDLKKTDGQNVTVETDAPVRPVGFSPNGSVASASIVYAGYGIVSEDPKFNDYEKVDSKGKIVLIFDGYPDRDNPQSKFRAFDARRKALIARDHGAAGVFLITRESDLNNDKLSKLTFDQTLGEAALPTFVVSRSMAANILGIDEGRLKAAEGSLSMRGTPGAVSSFGTGDTSAKASFTVDLVKKTTPAYNVNGILPGTDPKLRKEAIVIGAHYDHLGRGGPGSLTPNSSELHHGADDNASGVAAMLELARQFSRERKNKRTIIFMAFSGEEEGLLGSKYYVNNPIFPLENTVAMINLDMVGRLNENKLTIGGMGTASEWKTIIESGNRRKDDSAGPKIISAPIVKASQNTDTPPGIPKQVGSVYTNTFNLQLNEDGFGPSDHSSFYSKKIPVLFLFTGTHADYHKPSDSSEKINYNGEMSIVEFVRAVARSIDQNPVRPTYTVAKTAPTGPGRANFNVSLGTIPGYADSTDGLVIDGVRDNSPAAKAGLQAGDKIVKLAGKDVRNISDYMYVLGEMKAGEEYEVEVKRGTELLKLKIVPVKR